MARPEAVPTEEAAHSSTVRHPSRAILAVAALLPVLAGASGGQGEPEVPPLVWHVETAGGAPVGSRRADEPVNPASVVKLATTLWALERLGVDHRFETRFLARGRVADGTLDGDLVVRGGDDPDFQPENAFLVAAELNRLGVRRVSGALDVDEHFWIDWEGGSARAGTDAQARARRMARRLREALDPDRWRRKTRRAWSEFASRRGLPADRPPKVVVGGALAGSGSPAGDQTLTVHRSNPLVITLKRLNAYSNNDIERLSESLGGPRDLVAWLRRRWGDSPAGGIRLATLSGLGSNRMTARQAVRLVRDLRRTCEGRGIALSDLLPVAGCDPGTLDRFTRLRDGPHASAVVGKTGSLGVTDGGVAILAGNARTVEGDLLFCVASPRSGGRLGPARAAQERWLVELIAEHGGPRRRECGASVVFSDTEARVRSEPARAARDR